MQLILCSTSPSRKALLQRLQLTFEIIAPNIDESIYPSESPNAHVKRLAMTKAIVHAEKFPNALLIGSDQVAVLDNQIVSKPETHENAVEQLKKSSGKVIRFVTGLCLYNTNTKKSQIAVERFSVKYRQLTLKMIENYLLKEKPYQCAGSIKSEGLGIALFERVYGRDPTTLMGLPLICLVSMLENEGIEVL